MAKVMLVTPNYHCGVLESAGKWPPLGLVYIAGALRKAGHQVKIYDAMTKGHSDEQIIENILQWQPDVLGGSVYTATVPAVGNLFEQVKARRPNLVTILGGSHATFCYEEVLNEYQGIDYIVRYEGELALVELLQAMELGRDVAEIKGIVFRNGNEIKATELREYISDLDELETAWDLLDWEDYTFFVYPGSRLGVVSTARGCTHDCSFCSQTKFWQKKWRGRKPEKVIEEIEYLKTSFGIDVLFIADEYPTYDRQRWEEFLDLLIEKDFGINILMETRVDDILRDQDIIHKYKEAGVIHIYVGIEATDQSKLEFFNKGIITDNSKKALDIIHSANIVSETSFVLGTPDETPDTIEKTLEIAKAYNPDFAHFLFLAPWPYADLYEKVQPFIEEWDYSKYNLVEPVIKPKTMTREELFDANLNCYKSFYFGKIPEWSNLKSGFKRKYAVQSMKAIMENSFLKEHVLKMGSMPKTVEKLLKKILEE